MPSYFRKNGQIFSLGLLVLSFLVFVLNIFFGLAISVFAPIPLAIIGAVIYIISTVDYQRSGQGSSAESIFNQKWASAALLTGILLFAFFFRIYIGMHTNVDLDEGQLLYDAHLLKNGFVIFSDFTSRAPLILFNLVTLESITHSFGLLNAKILISTYFLLGSVVLLLIQKELGFSRIAMLWSTVLFNFFPSLFFYSLVLHVAQAFVFTLLVSLYFFILFLRRNKPIFLLLCSLSLTATYFIRGEVITYVPAIVLFIFVSAKNWKVGMKNLGILTFSGFAFYIIASYPFMKTIGPLAWDQFYGVQSLINQSASGAKAITSSKYFIISTWLVLNVTLFYIVIDGFLRDFFRKTLKKTWPHIQRITPYAILLMAVVFLFMHTNGNTGGFNPYQSDLLPFYILTNIILLITYERYKSTLALDIKQEHLFLLAEIIVPLGVIIWRLEDVHFSYFVATTVLIILLGSEFVARLFESNKWSAVVLIPTFTLLVLSGNYDFISTKVPERTYSQVFISNVSSKVDALTTQDQAIFSADTTLVIGSNREIDPPITHYSIYFSNTPWKFDLPDINHIAKYLEEERIPLLVVGFRTQALINISPELREYINRSYLLVSQIASDGQEVSFYMRKS